MKRLMMLVITMVSVFTVGAAYAADSQSVARTVARLTNGITYFDLGSPSTCNEPVGLVEHDVVKPFNGITAFDLAKPGSGAQGSCASREPQTITRNSYNGITVF
jgi:hypothetical protein